MDQSTQVNFPIVLKKIKRHNTSVDFYAANQRTTNSWNHLKPLRPKSLDHNGYLNNSTELATFASISRERTPPFSCSSSVASTKICASRDRLPLHHAHVRIDDESHTHTFQHPTRSQDELSTATLNDAHQHHQKCCHRCFATNSTQGLSWRRLHMSRAKLKATATTSELLSGFAMIAMVELQINAPTNVPEWLFVMFAICTTILVAVHIFALMISTYILPNIDAIAKLEVCEMVGESPHERMRGFIELAWAFSTVLGLFLFLVEVAILCWVKFWDYSFVAATAATVIVIPVLITFVLFAVHFYHSLVVYRCNTSTTDMEKLEDMKKHLDEVASPV